MKRSTKAIASLALSVTASVWLLVFTVVALSISRYDAFAVFLAVLGFNVYNVISMMRVIDAELGKSCRK